MKKIAIFFCMLLFISIHPRALHEPKPISSTLPQRIRLVCDNTCAWAKEHEEKIYKAMGAVVFVYGGRWYYTNYFNPFRQHVRINSSTCQGCSTLYNGSEVVQIPVKDQYDTDGGGAASCGYHSMRNGEQIIQALFRNIKDLGKRLLGM